MVGWHHGLNRHEFEQTPGDGEGQESLVCCSPWGLRVGHDLVIEQQQEPQPRLIPNCSLDCTDGCPSIEEVGTGNI